MIWSAELREAMRSTVVNQPWGVGQDVNVFTKAGQLVAIGNVIGVTADDKTVVIMDRMSGTDVHMEVDPKLYDVRVRKRDVTGAAPVPGKQPQLMMPSGLGAYSRRRF